MDCYEVGDALHGANIYAEARKMQGPVVMAMRHSSASSGRRRG